ncbi:hypothetical protein F4780DRAFT_669919 [Xylariomycetidae sp. FL0641]|nr:hypothetical protein F4780DRAFT_669919 [Xylariomycetidae sp. FL0641]
MSIEAGARPGSDRLQVLKFLASVPAESLAAWLLGARDEPACRRLLLLGKSGSSSLLVPIPRRSHARRNAVTAIIRTDERPPPPARARTPNIVNPCCCCSCPLMPGSPECKCPSKSSPALVRFSGWSCKRSPAWPSSLSRPINDQRPSSLFAPSNASAGQAAMVRLSYIHPVPLLAPLMSPLEPPKSPQGPLAPLLPSLSLLAVEMVDMNAMPE